MSGPLEGFIWLLLMFGFLGIAALCTVGSAVFLFLCRHKWMILITSIISWVGIKLVKNSGKKVEDKHDDFINVTPNRDEDVIETKVKLLDE